MNRKFRSPLLSTVIFGFSLALISGFHANAQQYPIKFSYLSVDNGLSHTDIHAVKQDKLGFIWIATLFGLDRYDGHTVKKFYNTNLPKHNAFKNRIRSMSLDENDRIWIGSEEGIQFFDPKSEEYTDVDNNQHNAGAKTYNKIFALKGNLLAAFSGDQPLLFKIKGNQLTDIPLSYPKTVRFTSMEPDVNGNIWLSSNKGIWLLDRSFQFRQFNVTNNLGGSYTDQSNVFTNRLDQVLITAGTTIASIDVKSPDLLLPSASSVLKLNTTWQITIPDCTYIVDIIQDKNLNYWVSTDAGLFLLDRTLNIRQHITAGRSAGDLSTNKLAKLFIDRSECLWVSTLETKINIIDLNAKPFYSLQHSEDPNSLSGNFISSVQEESDGKVWIGTNGAGLNEYDPKTQKFKHYNKKSKLVRLKNDNIHALALDNKRNLWIASDQGVQILNAKHDAIWQPKGYEKLPSHHITGLAKDFYGNMWFANFGSELGSIRFDEKNISQVTYHPDTFGHLVWADSEKPELFISTTQGLLRLIIDSTANIIKTFTYKAGNDPNSLSSDYTYQVQKQNDSTYWIGTIGGGLNRLYLKKNNIATFNTFDSKYGIFNDVETIEFDKNGNIWMGGNGLMCFNLKDKRLARFDKNDGLQGSTFKVGASYSAEDGRLYFGGMNGLNYFYPDSIKVNRIEACPRFTDMLINNKKVPIGTRDSLSINELNSKAISYATKLRLTYLQNDFVISFSAMHYANPKKCQYRYQLVGFDKEWKYTDGTNPSAAYNNLDYNDYKLIVQATNNDGIWSSQQATLLITVTPPWWKSTLAKIIYLILLLSVLIGIYVYQARWFRLKREVSIRNVEQKKQEELYQQQLQLNQQIQEKNIVLQEADEFKNKLVSMLAHDFRSPLSSTISIAQLMRYNQDFTAEEMERFYGSIEKDASQMLESFDIILQWIKQQLSGYQLKIESLDIHTLLNESAALFQNQMDTKKITFSNTIPPYITAIADKEMLQFVHRNLLSNAIKFSPEGSTITASCIESDEEITVGLSDEGTGMSDKVLSKLFSVSTQVGSTTREGAGIALSMCKDFIQKLNGRIWAENRLPNGAILYYTVPAEKSASQTINS